MGHHASSFAEATTDGAEKIAIRNAEAIAEEERRSEDISQASGAAQHGNKGATRMGMAN